MLERFSDAEREGIEAVIPKVLDAIEAWVKA